MQKIKILGEKSFQTIPVVDDMIEFEEEELAKIGQGKKFDLKTNEIIEDSDFTYIEQKKEKQINLFKELQELIRWFDLYDMQIKQFERNQRLGIESTYHIDGEEYIIEQLDAMAQKKASEAKALRNQLEELTDENI